MGLLVGTIIRRTSGGVVVVFQGQIVPGLAGPDAVAALGPREPDRVLFRDRERRERREWYERGAPVCKSTTRRPASAARTGRITARRWRRGRREDSARRQIDLRAASHMVVDALFFCRAQSCSYSILSAFIAVDSRDTAWRHRAQGQTVVRVEFAMSGDGEISIHYCWRETRG